MSKALLVLALFCSCAMAQVGPTNPTSDDTVVVGNTAQPVQWVHRDNIQAAITLAGPKGVVWIPAGYAGTDCQPISNCNPGTTTIIDLRTGGLSPGGVINVAVVNAGSLVVGPGSPLGISALDFNVCDQIGMFNSNGYPQLTAMIDPAQNTCVLTFNPDGAGNQNLFMVAQQASPYGDGSVWVWNDFINRATVAPGVSINSQTGAASLSSVAQLDKSQWVDGLIHPNLASAVATFTGQPAAGGIIYDNLPEDITQNPFPASFSGKVYFGTGYNSTTCGTGNVTCWVLEVPLIVPAGLDLIGAGPLTNGANFSGGTGFVPGSNFPAALGAPASPTLGCVASGGSLSGTYYVQVAYVNNLETYPGAAAVQGYSTPSAEVSQTCGASTGLSVTTPIAAGSGPLAASDFQIYVSTSSGAEVSGCSQVTQGCTGQNMTCGANGVGASDITACKLGSTATVTALPTNTTGNPPFLSDTTNPLIVLARSTRATQISFSTDIRDLAIMGSGSGSNTSTANEPCVGLYMPESQEESGPTDVNINGPFLCNSIYSAQDAVHWHLNNSLIAGGAASVNGGAASTTFLPVVMDNRTAGNTKVQGGTPHAVIDSTIQCRIAGVSCPAVIESVGTKGNLTLLGSHLETNLSTGDCAFVTQGAIGTVIGGDQYCWKSVLHGDSTNGGVVVMGASTGTGNTLSQDDNITGGTGNCNSNNSECSISGQSYASAFVTAVLSAITVNATTVNATAFVGTGSNGGWSASEGTGANCATGAGKDCIYPDSTLHCDHVVWNGVDRGCLVPQGLTPSVSSGFGTSPSVVASSGSAFFQLNVGTGGAATSGVVLMGTTAAHGWVCTVTDLNTNITTRETASSTTTVTVTGASAWTASDKLLFVCGQV